MIKYFSSILSKFTPKQRVFVITLLLLALVVVTLGPFIIKGFRPGNTELRKRLDQTQADNTILSNQLFILNGQVIKNQQECTNMLVSRENEMITQLEELEKKYTSKQSFADEKISPMMVDTIAMGVSPSLGETPVMIITDNSQSKTMLRDIRKIKEGIQKRIPIKNQ